MCDKVCAFCNGVDKLSMLSLLSVKGAISLNSAILKRGDSIPITSEGQYVHGNCRKNYSSKRKILQAIQNNNVLQQRNNFSVNNEEQEVSVFPFVHPKCLPPTSAAAKYHSLRTYFQVQEWKEKNNLIPCDFGWNLRDGQLHPLTTDLPPAPSHVLKLFKCSCAGSCSKGCSCRKNGLECSLACKNCKGLTCTNSDKCNENEESLPNTVKT